MNKLTSALFIAFTFVALITFSSAIAHADPTPSFLTNAVRVAKPTPKPVTSTVKHLTGKRCVTRPLEQQGTGVVTMVTACDM